MSKLLQLSWLIPFLPLLAAFFVGLLLISFNRTMNRLSKPVSLILSLSVGISALLSILMYEKHLSGVIFETHVGVQLVDFDLGFYVSTFSSLINSLVGITSLLIIISSYYFLERRQGYVRYLVSLVTATSLILAMICSGPGFGFLPMP